MSRPVDFQAFILLVLLSFIFSVLALAGGNPSQKIFSVKTYANTAMGGIGRLTMEGNHPAWCDMVADQVFASIRDWEQDVDHRSHSGSVGRVNGSSGNQGATVSSFAYDIIYRAVFLGKLTEGIFDITIGAITFEPFYYISPIPPASAGLVDYRKVILEPSLKKVILPIAGMGIDLEGGLPREVL